MFWDSLARRLGRRAVGTTVFFDAGCGFCRKSVLILRELLLLDGVELREAQSDPEIHDAMRRGNSWIVRDRGGAVHSRYDAFVALSRVSPVGRTLAWLLGSPPARAIGERIYRWISSDRDRASRLLGRLTPPPPRPRFGVASSVVALLALVLVEATLARRPTLGLAALKPAEGKLIQLGQLGQSWRMFAPHPNTDDGWYVIEGITADGRRVDVWNGGGAPDYAKPADLWPLYRNSQWQKYLVNVWQRRNRGYRVYFGRYLCREWNERHAGPDRVDMVYIKYMLETTPPPGRSSPEPSKESVLHHTCSAGPSPSVATTQ
jgi:predicted DCC family thiol-disulfide oxidoreductase YuxK